MLTVPGAEFGKTRIVPVHSITLGALRIYTAAGISCANTRPRRPLLSTYLGHVNPKSSTGTWPPQRPGETAPELGRCGFDHPRRPPSVAVTRHPIWQESGTSPPPRPPGRSPGQPTGPIQMIMKSPSESHGRGPLPAVAASRPEAHPRTGAVAPRPRSATGAYAAEATADAGRHRRDTCPAACPPGWRRRGSALATRRSVRAPT